MSSNFLLTIKLQHNFDRDVVEIYADDFLIFTVSFATTGCIATV